MKNQKLKIFIDESPLSSGHTIRGIGSYTRNLVESLKKQKDIKLVSDIEKADVVHYPYFDLFFNTLKLVNKPTVVTVYDVIPLLYPKYYQPGTRGKLNFKKQKAELKKVDAIITISETSKKDIVRFLDVSRDMIHVTHLAPNIRFRKLEIGNPASRDPFGMWKLEIKKRYGLPDRFVLYVGDVNYNKNIPNLIGACEISGLPLVIAGRQAVDVERILTQRNISGPRDWMRYVFGVPHPEHAHLAELAREFKSNKKVLRLGFVPDEDLVGLYNLATVYCQPSFYEGFGLPVLEAMACGCPVVAAKTQALVEVAEGHAVFVNPKDSKDIAGGLRKVISNRILRDELVKSGLTHAKELSWTKVASETAGVYHAIVSV